MLPRAARLKKSRDFQAVYRTRRTWSTQHLALHVRLRPAAQSSPTEGMVRLGFVISKKVAKRANERNRLKRRMREICRTDVLLLVQPQRPFDAFFVARASAPALNFRALAGEMLLLMRQAGLSAPAPERVEPCGTF